MQEMGKFLILTGLLIVLLGAGLYFWPQLSQLPLLRHLGRLPGDIAVKREGFRLYIPIATSLLLSLVLSLLLYWIGGRRR